MDNAAADTVARGLTHDEAAQIAADAAMKALKHTFELLGVDLDDFNSVQAFRRDVEWTRKWRKFSERAIGGAAMTAIAVATAAIVPSLWAWFRNLLLAKTGH